MAITEIQKHRNQLLRYTHGMLLPSNDLMVLPAMDKLIICQITPDKVIKRGPQGMYVPIGYIERCLNFVSNFDWGCKVQREGIKQVTRKVKDKTTKAYKDVTAYDAWVLADFYIQLDGRRIERSCYGSWIMYSNPATSEFNCLEAARSIATKAFADTLGIASDKLAKEFDERREKIENEIINGDTVEPTDGKHKEALGVMLRQMGYTTSRQVDMRLDKQGYDCKWSSMTEIQAQKISLSMAAKTAQSK